MSGIHCTVLLLGRFHSLTLMQKLSQRSSSLYLLDPRKDKHVSSYYEGGRSEVSVSHVAVRTSQRMTEADIRGKKLDTPTVSSPFDAMR